MARRSTARKEWDDEGPTGGFRDLFFDDFGLRTTTVAVGGFLIVVVLVIFAIWADGMAERECKARGGERVNHTYNGYDSSGKFVTMTETECVIPR